MIEYFNLLMKAILLYKFQFGFRTNFNTTMALITLVDKIVNGIHNNEMTLGTFLDFSKAFDK